MIKVRTQIFHVPLTIKFLYSFSQVDLIIYIVLLLPWWSHFGLKNVKPMIRNWSPPLEWFNLDIIAVSISGFKVQWEAHTHTLEHQQGAAVAIPASDLQHLAAGIRLAATFPGLPSDHRITEWMYERVCERVTCWNEMACWQWTTWMSLTFPIMSMKQVGINLAGEIIPCRLISETWNLFAATDELDNCWMTAYM